MEGIDFRTNEKGRKTAVVIDLDLHGELWEDFYDAIVVEARHSEPRRSMADVKADLVRCGKLTPRDE